MYKLHLTSVCTHFTFPVASHIKSDGILVPDVTVFLKAADYDYMGPGLNGTIFNGRSGRH